MSGVLYLPRELGIPSQSKSFVEHFEKVELCVEIVPCGIRTWFLRAFAAVVQSFNVLISKPIRRVTDYAFLLSK